MSAFTELSFVRRSKRRNSNWHLPAPPSNYVEAKRVNPDGSCNTTDVALYGIGCGQGKKAAHEYLDFIRRNNPNRCGGYLQHLVLGMLEAPQDNLLRGQIVGFFFALECEAFA